MQCTLPRKFPENHISGAHIPNRGSSRCCDRSAVRPFGIEIFLNEIGAFTVDVIHQFFCFLFTLATAKKPPDFVSTWSIGKIPLG
jgi:hypothetical protein